MAAPTAGSMAALAPGGMAQLELALLLDALYHGFGHDYRGHDRVMVADRLRALIDARSLASMSALQERLLRDDGVARDVVRALAAAPAGLFDDPAETRELRALLAGLHASEAPKIWLSGCTSAAEAWTLAIVLAGEGLGARTQVFATCADDALTQDMRNARMPAAALAHSQERYRLGGGAGALADFFEIDGELARPRPQLRERITWATYSLVTDASFNEFDAILGNRALPGFGAALRQRALNLFYDSLVRLGVLALDRQMAPADAHASSYQAIGAQGHWYKRVA